MKFIRQQDVHTLSQQSHSLPLPFSLCILFLPPSSPRPPTRHKVVMTTWVNTTWRHSCGGAVSHFPVREQLAGSDRGSLSEKLPPGGHKQTQRLFCSSGEQWGDTGICGSEWGQILCCCEAPLLTTYRTVTYVRFFNTKSCFNREKEEIHFKRSL